MAVSGDAGTNVLYLLSNLDSHRVLGSLTDNSLAGTQAVGIVTQVNGDGSRKLAVFGDGWIIYEEAATSGNGNGQWQAIA